MSREKFDDDLRLAMLEHEETSRPSFDRNEVWRNAIGNRRRKNLTAISVAASILLALCFFIPEKRDQIVEKRFTRKVTYHVTSKPVTVEAIREIPQISRQEIVTPENLSQIETAPLPSSSLVNPNPEIRMETPLIAAQPILTQVSPETKTESLADDKDEIKVTFKRGKSEAPRTISDDVLITYKRGSKQGFNHKSRPSLTDTTSYYVNSDQPFKLKFKR